jgi:predicted nucleotidyltransferase component of viral defense system
VPSYSLELLLAKKTIAMLSRMVYKDIYDMWIGLQMMKETDRYAEYLKKLIRYEKTDASLLLKQFEYYSGHYPPAKLRESIAAAYAIPNTGIVVNDVISKLESILE